MRNILGKISKISNGSPSVLTWILLAILSAAIGYAVERVLDKYFGNESPQAVKITIDPPPPPPPPPLPSVPQGSGTVGPQNTTINSPPTPANPRLQTASGHASIMPVDFNSQTNLNRLFRDHVSAVFERNGYNVSNDQCQNCEFSILTSISIEWPSLGVAGSGEALVYAIIEPRTPRQLPLAREHQARMRVTSLEAPEDAPVLLRAIHAISPSIRFAPPIR